MPLSKYARLAVLLSAFAMESERYQLSLWHSLLICLPTMGADSKSIWGLSEFASFEADNVVDMLRRTTNLRAIAGFNARCRIQSTAKRWSPGCVDAAGKSRQKR